VNRAAPAPTTGDAPTRTAAAGAATPPLVHQLMAGSLFALATFAASGLGSIATSRGEEWNEQLDKPFWYPPGATFGIVWSALYVAIAIAGWLAWRSGGGLRTTVPWLVQMGLNLGWSVVFFGLRRPGWALVEIVVLLAAIAWTIAAMWPVDRRAGALMVPYLAWVAFATALNTALVVLNA
jgi:translocator protein